MSSEQNKTHKLKDGNEILLGLDLYGTWAVSHWSDDYDLISSSKFKSYEEADKFFEEWKLK